MTASLSLPAVLDLAQAEALKAALLPMRGQSVVIDASRVERLGGLCLQVLISAQQTWASDGHSLKIDDVSREFADQWNAFGAASADRPLGALS
ncbi:STAS domain-containing protein [Brevundimonas sp.]|uniref:STAS domain-containing protein n=1 Tax=Brevundimonas sp. TaxID=1871086 RepID=UPI00286ADC43|nr:STAS domain-containing protein [Brevundimonas sp.]